MAKLYFHYAAMNAGKTTTLLQAAFNYRERGMETSLFTAAIDTRRAEGVIASRIGLESEATTFSTETDLYADIERMLAAEKVDCIFVDEAQFLSSEQVVQLARVVDKLNVPVMCYGLRTDFRGELFPGSARLLALADEIRELKTICFCGKKATMTVRFDANGVPIKQGDQVSVGGNESYKALCRKHFYEAMDSSSV